MPTKDKSVIITQEKPEVIKSLAIKESQPLLIQAKALVVDDESSYQLADTLRTKLKAANKAWTDRLSKIIRPTYEALESLYSLQREIVNPMKDSEKIITGKMQEYKRLELQRVEEDNRKRQEEEDGIQREKEELQRKIDAAKNKSVAALQQKKMEKLEEKLETVQESVAVSVKAEGSGTRIVKKWKVVSFIDLVKAVANGDLPEDILQTADASIQEYFNAGPDALKTWPGLEIYSDVQIVSRRGV